MKTLASLLALPALALTALAGSVTLEWDKNTEPDIAGYRVYWHGTNQVYATNRMLQVNGTNTVIATVSNLYGRIWFVATAFNVSALESDYSNEVIAEMPVKPPTGLRVKTILQASTSVIMPQWKTLADLGERTVSVDNTNLFVRGLLQYELVDITPVIPASRITGPTLP
jgi:hypothetical protein